MKKTITIVLTVLLSTAAIIGGAYAIKKLSQPEPSPEQVVSRFYEEWLGYQEKGSPLADRIYRQSDLATKNLVDKLDATIDSFEFGGYDPVLCAQDIPSEYNVNAVDVRSDSAKVVIKENFFGTAKNVYAGLVKEDGKWKIDDIDCENNTANQPDNGNLPSVPVQQMVGDYIRENISQLSPKSEVLGGKFYINEIVFTGPNSGHVEYEDGHILLEADFNFEISGQDVVIKNFGITSE